MDRESSATRITSDVTQRRATPLPADFDAHGIELSDATVISSAPPDGTVRAFGGLAPRELGNVLIGQRLDDVVLEEFIGGGGMGAVFRGRDESLDRLVAVKVLSTHQIGDSELQRRFQTEAQSAARLDHPCIARVNYVGEDLGLQYIVFEYIEGQNLRDRVLEAGRLSVSEALSYVLQITDALTHAWQRNVVHRDIKPSNVLITPGGQAKLVDLGLARLLETGAADQELTATGMTLGTFDYVSPEQARDPRDADSRSDIYSLGCTLFFLLTGRAPFAEGTPLQKLLSHQSDPPPALHSVLPNVPPLLDAVLAKMLAKNPADRFQTPPELTSALLTLGEQVGLPRPPLTATLFANLPEPASRRLTRHLVWILPLALVLAGVGLRTLMASNRPGKAGFENDPLALPDSVPAAFGEPGDASTEVRNWSNDAANPTDRAGRSNRSADE